MDERNKAGFIRWQDKTIAQMGFLNNLLIGITTGELYLGLNMIIDKKARLSGINQVLLSISILATILSLVVGCCLAYNRLHSFRITMHLARDRGNVEEPITEKLRRSDKTSDKITWILIRLQMGFFLTGTILTGILIFNWLWI